MTRLLTQLQSSDAFAGWTRADTGTVTEDGADLVQGSPYLSFDAINSYRQWTRTSTIGVVHFETFIFKAPTLPSANIAIANLVNTGGSNAGRLFYRTNGTVQWANSGGTFVGNPTGVISLGGAHLVEMGWSQNATAANGTIELWFDGVQVQASMNADLTNVAINRFRLGRDGSATFTSGTPRIARIVVNDNVGSAPDNTFQHPALPPGSAAELRPSGNERRPVNPCGSFNINNVTLGTAGDRLGVRFVLDQAKAIYRMVLPVRLSGATLDGAGNPWTSEPAGTGYAGGNGGTIKFDLFAVNSSTGFATGGVIATDQLNVVDRYLATKTLLGITTAGYFVYAHFNTASQPAGEYVVIISNVDATPATNFFSVNCPTTSLTVGGPHAANTRSKFTTGGMMGLDPREALMWSIDSGTHWYFGNPVGGETLTHGITGGEARPGPNPKYYVGSGDDACRLPFYGFVESDVTREGLQPYYGGNTDVTGGKLTATNAGRAVTVTDAGAFAHSGQSVGTITVTNIHTGVVRTCTPGGTGGKREAALDATLAVGAGETITIEPSGTVALENADNFQVQAFGLGSGDFPFTTLGNGSGRLAAYVLPWPYFAAPTTETAFVRTVTDSLSISAQTTLPSEIELSNAVALWRTAISTGSETHPAGTVPSVFVATTPITGGVIALSRGGERTFSFASRMSGNTLVVSDPRIIQVLNDSRRFTGYPYY